MHMYSIRVHTFEMNSGMVRTFELNSNMVYEWANTGISQG